MTQRRYTTTTTAANHEADACMTSKAETSSQLIGLRTQTSNVSVRAIFLPEDLYLSPSLSLSLYLQLFEF